MAQKINPIFFRIGKLGNQWNSKVFLPTKREYSNFVVQDILCRNMIMKDYKKAEISKILISKTNTGALNVNIMVNKSSFIVGKQGELVDKLKKKICKIFHILFNELVLNVTEEKKPDLSASILANRAARQLEDRASFKKVMKMVVDTAMKGGARGAKVIMSGRLAGAEIARSEVLTRGSIPLHTLKAKIDYALGEAITVYGVIGVKVIILR